MKRRDLLLGAGCLAAFAGAEALKPRRLVSLMGGRTLTRVLPLRFAGWETEGGGDFVVPKEPGSLADMLYNETVMRSYRHGDGGPAVMMLAAHGDSQSDLLQLHRPEVCYQAVGFSIVGMQFDPLPLPPATALPVVEMTARAGSRVEDVLYWTRLGEFVPTTAGEQRADRLKTAFEGVVADGVLMRVSAVREGEAADWPRLRRFAADMVRAVAPDARAGLIGTTRAKALT